MLNEWELLEGDNDYVIKEIVKHGFRELIVNEEIDRELINTLRVNYGILISITPNLYNEKDYDYIYKDIKDIRLQTKFFFTCYLVLSEGSPVYHSYIVNVPGEYPSAKDIKTFCDAVVKNNSEITTCVVLSINRLRE